MLEELHVRHICGIAQASLHFRPGLVAITGESGAGKSSLVRALEFLCGKRAHASLLRSGAEEADVQGVFCLDHLKGVDDLYQPQEGVLVVRRVLSSNAKGKITIQGSPAPLGVLAGIMGRCAAIQSQFAQLSLLDPLRQRDILDSTGDGRALKLRASLQRHMEELGELRHQEKALLQRQKEVEERHENVAEVAERVRQMGVTAGAEEDIARELHALEQRRTHRRKLGDAERLLLGGVGASGLLGDLEALCELFRHLSFSSEIKEMEGLGEQALRTLQQLNTALGKSLGDSEEMLDQEQERLEARWGTLRRIKRLLRVNSLEEVLLRCQEVEEATVWLQTSREDLLILRKRAETLQQELRQEAHLLRAQRQEGAQNLETTVNRILEDLAMEGAPFRVQLQPLDKIRPHGAEEVSFLLEMGDGGLHPMARSASGGELSRILLAIQLALPSAHLPRVLVFDEVEAGLGGKAALLAGYKLQELAARCHVILITHEATLAARANQHFAVFRRGEETFVEELSQEARVGEIARMLCGDALSPEARAHAATLLTSATNGPR